MPGNRLLTVALPVLALASLAGARGDDQAVPVRRAIATYNSLTETTLPLPRDDDMTRLTKGQAVILRERTSVARVDGKRQDHIRVVGYQLVRRPRLLVWLATLDIGTQHSNRLTEHLVQVDERGGSTWYQYLNTPWPVGNRHWLIRNVKSIDLAARSNGLVWEHRWRLAQDGEQLARNLLRSGQVIGIEEHDADNAIYLSINRGAWTMFAIDEDTTLVVAHTTASMGGWIPESWVARFVGRQFGTVLRNLEDRADWIHNRYTAGYPVFSGAGERITPRMATEERERYDARRTTNVILTPGAR